MLYGVSTMKPAQIMGAGNYAQAGHYMDGNTVFHNLRKVNFADGSIFNCSQSYLQVRSVWCRHLGC
ncbi:hypothetical protein FHL02_11025 [Lactobacillus salsicarnum]|uniref:Uncharacterized protein n=1 Tax=Companilactobacillus mishanensis TaxID=2486008 RepID=A0A5P0ZKF7_9LACO|nr:hypothetical protein [Companilactobacillus mishanensis]